MSKIEISIIIATRNREEILWESIEKACEAINKKNAEIIIINDGDSSLIVPDSVKGKVGYFDNPKKGVSSARNLGVLKAKGDILFFADDDMWINDKTIDWIFSFIIYKKNINEVYVINWEYPDYLKDSLERTKIGRYLLSANYHTLWGRLHVEGAKPASGLYKYDSVGSGSLVMHKKIFNKAGGYNEKITFQGEDAFLAEKLNELEIPIYVVFDITLYHNHCDRLEINNFLQRIYDGFGSEFIAINSGEVLPLIGINYNGTKKMIFEFSRLTEKAWISFLNFLPNHPIITPLNNKIIGALGGLQRYKQWRNIMD
jgi:glycosyltransferase involved in cell wall biosynthesis